MSQADKYLIACGVVICLLIMVDGTLHPDKCLTGHDIDAHIAQHYKDETP